MSTRGDDVKLSANQEKALAALLATPTYEAAAKRCGLNERTIRRYLKDPEFKARYAEERTHLLDETVAGLQKLGITAADTLRRNLKSDTPHAQIRAARSVLEFMFKGTELVELEERLRVLEEEADESGW